MLRDTLTVCLSVSLVFFTEAVSQGPASVSGKHINMGPCSQHLTDVIVAALSPTAWAVDRGHTGLLILAILDMKDLVISEAAEITD